MRCLLQTFSDHSRTSAESICYFTDYTLADRYFYFLKVPYSQKSLTLLSYSQFIKYSFLLTYGVFLIVNRKSKFLGSFKTLQDATDFMHFYKSEYPFTKLIITDYGLRTSAVDPQSSLF